MTTLRELTYHLDYWSARLGIDVGDYELVVVVEEDPDDDPDFCHHQILRDLQITNVRIDNGRVVLEPGMVSMAGYS